jgi:hypothetical protein
MECFFLPNTVGCFSCAFPRPGDPITKCRRARRKATGLILSLILGYGKVAYPTKHFGLFSFVSDFPNRDFSIGETVRLRISQRLPTNSLEYESLSFESQLLDTLARKLHLLVIEDQLGLGIWSERVNIATGRRFKQRG